MNEKVALYLFAIGKVAGSNGSVTDLDDEVQQVHDGRKVSG
jgi:hypothetical protein